MRWLVGFLLLFGVASAQIPERLILHPGATKGTKFRSPFYTDVRPDPWIAVWRLELVVDAAQTYSILGSHGQWGERNRLYDHLSPLEGSAALLAVGWLTERALTGIHDRRVRIVLGWLMVAGEAWVIGENAVRGVPLLSIRF